MKEKPSGSPFWQLKKRKLLLTLSSLITKPIKLDLSNLHYGLHYEKQSCVIRDDNITAPIMNPIKDPSKDPIKDPIKDTLVPMGL